MEYTRNVEYGHYEGTLMEQFCNFLCALLIVSCFKPTGLLNQYFNDEENVQRHDKTLPKALRTQALTALTSNFGLVGLVQYAW